MPALGHCYFEDLLSEILALRRELAQHTDEDRRTLGGGGPMYRMRMDIVRNDPTHPDYEFQKRRDIREMVKDQERWLKAARREGARHALEKVERIFERYRRILYGNPKKLKRGLPG